MKFKRSRYPDIPGHEQYSSPCWKLTGRWIWADIDWNMRFPFGASIGVSVGRNPKPGNRSLGFCLDINAPIGEPNRLYLTGPRRDWMIGLITWWTFRETGRHETTHNGRVITQIEGEDVRCRPRLERGQAWDWKRSEGSDRWRWIVSHPRDWADRWAAAHPEEAAAAEERRRQMKAKYKEAP